MVYPLPWFGRVCGSAVPAPSCPDLQQERHPVRRLHGSSIADFCLASHVLWGYIRNVVPLQMGKKLTGKGDICFLKILFAVQLSKAKSLEKEKTVR